MRTTIRVLTGVTALTIVPALGAQQKKAEPKPETRKIYAPEADGCKTEDGKTQCIYRRGGFDSAMMKRPAIGVQLAPTGTSRDTLGVFISRVVPKGPAENAGIVEGERIVSINGVDLRVNAADAGDEYAASLPSRRLNREVGKLQPGNVATLRVYAGGRTRDVQVTIGRASDMGDSFGMMGEGFMPGQLLRSMPDFENLRTQLRAMPQMRMEQMPRMRMEQMPRMRMEQMPRIHMEYMPRGEVDGLRDKIWYEDGVKSRSMKEKELTETKKALDKAKADKKKN